MRPSGQRGFTLVEVMIAIVVLLVGVLGVVALVDGANAVTSKTRAREAGTNLARSVIEVSRSIRYRDLSTASLEAQLGARPPLSDVSDPGYRIRSRGVDYRTTVSVCSIDDPKDGLGERPPGVTFCGDSDALPVGGAASDRNPDDYKRVRVTLVWTTRATEQSVTQTSSIINPVGGLGPSVSGLTMTSPSSTSSTPPLRIDSDVESAQFTAVTSGFAAELNWSVGGQIQGKADGGPTDWEFQWFFEDPTTQELLYPDCTYVVQADAFDEQGRAGAPYALTVIVNRLPALPVAGLDGGRNGTTGPNGELVDLQWTKNFGECDVVGYRVYRSSSSDPTDTTQYTQIDCLDQDHPSYTTVPRCIDDTAQPGVDYHYRVRGIDTEANGSLRPGDWSAPLAAPATANQVPTAPADVSLCVGGQLDCNSPDGEPAPTGVVVVRWTASTDPDGSVDFYRIYRDGTAYTNRHDRFFPGTGLIAWMEYLQPDGQPHSYRVSAVDDDFGESPLSAEVSGP